MKLRMDFSNKACRERIVRFEARAAEARANGDANEAAKWQEAVDAANDIIAENNKRGARGRAGFRKPMVEIARDARAKGGIRDYSPEEDAEIAAAWPDVEKLSALALKLNRSFAAIRTRYYRLARGASASGQSAKPEK